MRAFRAILAQENVETAEGWLIREFPAGCFSWRALPLTLMSQIETPDFGGHGGAFILGRIDTIVREGDMIVARGVLDDEGEGAEADRRRDTIRLIDQRMLNGVSVDPGAIEVTETCEQMDDEGFCERVRLRFDVYEIGGATATTLPALEGTLIELVDDDAADDESDGADETGDDAPDEEAVAAAASITVPDHPPIDWFDDPGLTELTRTPVVTDDGRVFGHLASWQDCHISFPSYCQQPWHSASNYAYFHVCSITAAADDGAMRGVAVGPLAVRGGHYPTQGDHARRWRDAQAHYDDPSNVAAYVRMGEDEHGIWFAGSLRSGVDPALVATLRAHQLSGDWRRIGGSMEVVGACSVNVPGFVRQVALAASGNPAEPLQVEAAVISGGGQHADVCCDDCAAGRPCATAASGADDRLARFEAELATMRRALDSTLRDLALARLRPGVHARG